jgi:hypothetical protein
VLDPFAGSGTVLVEAENAGLASIGLESHPFVARVAAAKIGNSVEAEALREYGYRVLDRANKLRVNIERHPTLIRKCFPDETLLRLDQLRQSLEENSDDNRYNLGWLALAAILRACSPVGTANWQ